MNSARLAEVALINPRDGAIAADDLVSFVGMAQLDAVQAVATPLETRRFAEVAKGYTIFRDGDVLAAKITPCWENGKIGQAKLGRKVGVGSTEFHIVRVGPNLEARYLLHFLRQPMIRTSGESRMTGSAGQRRVPVAFLQNLRVPLPPLDEQVRIAGILDRADGIRAKRRQALAHLDTLTQSIFHDMFSNYTRMTRLGEVISEGPTNGMYRPLSDYGSGTPILRIDGFNSGVIKAGPWKRVRISTSEGERYSLAVGDIVVNRVNALSHLGKAALIEHLDEPSVYESNMMRIRLDTARVIPRFALAWLQSAAAKRQILKKAKKAINQASVNQRDIRSLLMPLPARDVQATFAQRAEWVNAERAVVQRALNASNELFESLQARAFRGEL